MSNVQRLAEPSSGSRTGITPAEWHTRVELAAFHRLYVHFGWTDLIYTHLTARSPDNPRHYLIKPDHLMMDEVTASNLIKVDFEGNLVAGDCEPNYAGLFRYKGAPDNPPSGVRVWPAMLRLLDRKGDNYRD